jgi:endoglucanase Acf2
MPRISLVSRSVLCCALFASSVFSQTPISVGKAKYFDSSTPQTRLVFPAFPPYVTTDFSQKVITDRWWTTLQSTQFSQPMHPHPASFKATAAGLEMAYLGAPTTQGNGFFTTYAAGITVGVDGLAADAARVASYTHWSVTARWQSGAELMEATLASGSPFAFFKIQGGNAVITCAAAPIIWYNSGGVIGLTVNGKNYGIFAPTGSAWTGTTNLSSSLAGKDYLSVAVLPDNAQSTLDFFRQYAYSFVVNTIASWTYVEKTAQLVTTFAVTTVQKEGTETGTVFGLFRHQWLNLMPGTPLAPYTYASARGQMKVTTGTSFQTVMTFNGLLMTMPDTGYDKPTLDKYLNSDGIPGQIGGDTYAKPFGRCANLALIANMRGNTAKRDQIVAMLETSLQTWFSANLSGEYFYYNKTWNRLVGCPASFGSDNRFADHHFHYGYFLKAAAVVAQFDPTWAQQANWGGMVEMLIRDVNCPYENDPLFGRFAYFEPYEGHGYADGLGGENDNVTKGNDQESSSEAMDFNQALIHWGVATKNNLLRDQGIFQYTQETRAIEQYWWDVDNVNFPADFPKPCIGMIWSSGGVYATWFSGDAAAIQSINFLPITPGSLYVGRRPDYIPINDAAGYNGGWDDQFNEFLVFADPVKAMQRSSNGTHAGNMFDGNSASYYYLHMNSVSTLGTLNVNVGADVPTYAVFDKNSLRAYTAYNPDDTVRTVTFTDGYQLAVPAKTQITRGGIFVSAAGPAAPVPFRPQLISRKTCLIDEMHSPAFDPGAARMEIFDVKGRMVFEKSRAQPAGGAGERSGFAGRGVYIVRQYR